MQGADNLASDSLAMSSGIALIAVYLGLRQWYERRAREPDLCDADRLYLSSQDVRRGLGVAVMLILAVGILIGARIEPRVGGRANLLYLEVWVTVIGLLIAMITLAGLDWLATSRYARRQRRAIAEERMKLLEEVIRQSAKSDRAMPDEIDEVPE
jgi:hypothetical protein